MPSSITNRTSAFNLTMTDLCKKDNQLKYIGIGIGFSPIALLASLMQADLFAGQLR